MKVTKLSAQERNTERVSMFLDDRFSCGLSLNTLAKYNIFVGKELDDEEYKDILYDDLGERLFNRAADYLGSTIKSAKQVRTYLQKTLFKKKGLWYEELKKEDMEELVQNTINKLEKYSYLNDSEFAQAFIQSRVINKPRGKNILLSELITKGVSKELAEEKLDELIDDEYDMLKRVYEKKYRDEVFGIKERKKIDFLLRKGFNWELIERLINEKSEE